VAGNAESYQIPIRTNEKNLKSRISRKRCVLAHFCSPNRPVGPGGGWGQNVIPDPFFIWTHHKIDRKFLPISPHAFLEKLQTAITPLFFEVQS